MKEDSALLDPLLLDEDYSESKLVHRSSYLKEPWGLLLQNSVEVWCIIKSSIQYNRSCFSHNRAVTGPLIIGSTLALILVSFILLWYNLPVQEQHCNSTPFEAGGPKNLTVATLLEAKKSEPFSGAMENCMEKAIKEFTLEPNVVQENAKMVLECNGTRKEFVSGKGENYIEVLWMDGHTSYKVKEANSEVHRARLGRQPLPLSLASILRVYQELASREGSEELRQCLNKTIEELPKEPQAVQNDAILVVSCGENDVTFRSGAGKSEITVYKDMHGKIEFNVKCTGWAWWARLFRRRAR